MKALTALARGMDPAQFSCRLVEYHRHPAMRVVSLEATALTDTIVAVARADGVAFHWSWGDLLGSDADIPAAVHRVVYVLSLPGGPLTPA